MEHYGGEGEVGGGAQSKCSGVEYLAEVERHLSLGVDCVHRYRYVSRLVIG